MATIHSLPAELLELIADQLAVEESSFNPDDGMFEGNLEHIVDIKALRLSCRAFATVCRKHLFAKVWLFMTDDSFQKFQCVASAPHLARHVRKLKIFWQLFEKRLITCEKEYEAQVRLGENGRDVSSGQLANGWRTLSPILEQHDRLSQEVERTLASAFQSLPNLVSVEPGVADEILRSREAMKIQSGRVPKLANQIFLKKARLGWREELLDGGIVHKLFRAMHSSQVRVTDLTLFNCGANIESNFLEFPSELGEDVVKAVVGTLQQVRLRLEDLDEGNLKKIVCSGLASRFIGWLSSLRRLSLQTCRFNNLCDLGDLCGSCHCPMLQELALYNVSAKASSVIQIISRHRASLVRISLVQILLTQGTWKKALTSLRDHRRLRWCDFESNLVRRGSRDRPEYVCIKGEGIELAVNKYALRGAPWPKDMCAEFELEAQTY